MSQNKIAKSNVATVPAPSAPQAPAFKSLAKKQNQEIVNLSAMALLKTFRKDFVHVVTVGNDARYASMELYADRKAAGTLTVRRVNPLTNEGYFTSVAPSDSAQLREDDLICFRVVIHDYVYNEVKHNLIGVKGWSEVKTTFFVFTNGKDTVVRELRAGRFHDAELLMASIDEDGDSDAVKADLEGMTWRFCARLVNPDGTVNTHAEPMNQRKGFFKGVTPYGAWLRQKGQSDASMKEAGIV